MAEPCFSMVPYKKSRVRVGLRLLCLLDDNPVAVHLDDPHHGAGLDKRAFRHGLQAFRAELDRTGRAEGRDHRAEPADQIAAGATKFLGNITTNYGYVDSIRADCSCP